MSSTTTLCSDRIERLLKQAGYEVVTYPSAQHLLDRLPASWSWLRPPRRADAGIERPGASGSLERTWFDPADSVSDRPRCTQTTVQTIKAGAQDFLTKPVSSDDLLRAVERAMAHHEMTRSLTSKLDAVRSRIATLTPRERQVFELVVRGKMNKQIATQLGTSARTVKAHRERVMEKMQVQSLAELVSLAERARVLNGASGNGQTA